MARMNAAEREAFMRQQEREQKQERKQRGPSVGGSLKEGVKAAVKGLVKGVGGGGEADVARQTLAKGKSETEEEAKKIEKY